MFKFLLERLQWSDKGSKSFRCRLFRHFEQCYPCFPLVCSCGFWLAARRKFDNSFRVDARTHGIRVRFCLGYSWRIDAAQRRQLCVQLKDYPPGGWIGCQYHERRFCYAGMDLGPCTLDWRIWTADNGWFPRLRCFYCSLGDIRLGSLFADNYCQHWGISRGNGRNEILFQAAESVN